MAIHSSILARKIPQRSVEVYGPWGCKDSDMTGKIEHILSITRSFPFNMMWHLFYIFDSESLEERKVSVI